MTADANRHDGSTSSSTSATSTAIPCNCEHWKVWRTADRLEQHGITMTTTTTSPPAYNININRNNSNQQDDNDEIDQENSIVETGSYDEVTAIVVRILRSWGHTWGGDAKWQSFLNKSRLLEEVEECIVALHHLREWRRLQQQKQQQQQERLSLSSQSSPASSTPTEWIAVDVCCGKGLFAMLLSYLTTYYPDEFHGLKRIVLLDKATSATIDYHHIHVANASCQSEQRPYLDLWEGCNLHDYDDMLDRLTGFKVPIALTGIHLCNMLSPACLGLANGLGPQSCPYLCLAPCCLPRLARLYKKNHNQPKCGGCLDSATVTTAEASVMDRQQDLIVNDTIVDAILSINCFETFQERTDRRRLAQQRDDARRRKRQTKPSPNHATLENSSTIDLCQVIQPLPLEDASTVTTTLSSLSSTTTTVAPSTTLVARSPCWKCGQSGHIKADCLSRQPSSRPPRVVPPARQVSVAHILQSARPFDTYCHVLASTLQDFEHLQMVEAGIGENNHHLDDDNEDDDDDLYQADHKNKNKSKRHSSKQKHQAPHGNNWNAGRKNIFIVASR